MKDEPKLSFNQVPLFVSHTLTSDNQTVSKLSALNSVETKTITEDVTHTTYSAQASGSVVSASALNSGDLSINGVPIGASSSGSAKDIASAINQKTSLSGVTANAGNTNTSSTSLVQPSRITQNINLGALGNLINPVEVDGGNYFYYWDRNGDGAAYYGGGTDDSTTMSFLNTLLNKDVNGNSTNYIDETFRYGILNGINVALPTVAGVDARSRISNLVGAYQPTSSIGSASSATSGIDSSGFNPVVSEGSNEINPIYDDMLAIWDAYNGQDSGSSGPNGTPPGWRADNSTRDYWTATRYANAYAVVNLSRGYVFAEYSGPSHVVALQVFTPPAETVDFASIASGDIQLNGVNIGSIATASSSSQRATQILTAINAKTSSTGVVASLDTATGGINLSAVDGRNIVISTLTSSAITGDQIGIALNGVTSGLRSVTTYSSNIDLTSTSSSGISIIANANGSNASGLTTGATAPNSTTTSETVTTQVQVPSTKTEVQNSPEKLFFINLSTAESSQASLTFIDLAIDAINQSRAALGGYQSRFSSAVEVTESEITNLSSSKSRIVDADYAIETTNLAKFQIMSQAATSMLAQANIPNQVVQQLLKDF